MISITMIKAMPALELSRLILIGGVPLGTRNLEPRPGNRADQDNPAGQDNLVAPDTQADQADSPAGQVREIQAGPVHLGSSVQGSRFPLLAARPRRKSRATRRRG